MSDQFFESARKILDLPEMVEVKSSHKYEISSLNFNNVTLLSS